MKRRTLFDSGEGLNLPERFPSPSDTQPTFLEELLSHRRRVRSRRDAKKETKKGSRRSQREDVAEENSE